MHREVRAVIESGRGEAFFPIQKEDNMFTKYFNHLYTFSLVAILLTGSQTHAEESVNLKR